MNVARNTAVLWRLVATANPSWSAGQIAAFIAADLDLPRSTSKKRKKKPRSR